MIVFRRHLMRIGMACFDEDPDRCNVDILRFHQRPSPLPGGYSRECYTMVVDLRKSPEELTAALDRTTAYQVRRARERDGAVCDYPDPRGEGILDSFWHFYAEFAATKDMPLPSAVERKRMDAMAAAGVLTIARVRSSEGEALAYHSYLRAGTGVLMQHACSLHKLATDPNRRALVGRANRFLFWSDFLHFKELGVSTYDFGGWYEGQSDTARLTINRFKEGFGGQVVRIYFCEKGCTARGRIALWLRHRLPGE